VSRKPGSIHLSRLFNHQSKACNLASTRLVAAARAAKPRGRVFKLLGAAGDEEMRGFIDRRTLSYFVHAR
jgi:hypothetical protein